MDGSINSQAPLHIPGFLPGPDGGDGLFTFVVILTIALVLGFGVLYFRLHALPEQMAHKTNSTQLQLIGILALLAMFTHNNLFWVFALLLAAVKIPDIVTPLQSISRSLAKISKREKKTDA